MPGRDVGYLSVSNVGLELRSLVSVIYVRESLEKPGVSDSVSHILKSLHDSSKRLKL